MIIQSFIIYIIFVRQMSKNTYAAHKNKIMVALCGNEGQTSFNKHLAQQQVKQVEKQSNNIQKDNGNQNLNDIDYKNQVSNKTKNNFAISMLPKINLKKNGKITNDNTAILNLAAINQNSKQLKAMIKKNSSPEPVTSEQRIQLKPVTVKKLQSKQTIDTCRLNQTKTTSTNLSRPPSLLNNQYDYIDRSQILFKKDEIMEHQLCQEFIAFWKTKSCYVRIIRSQNALNQYCEQQQHYKGLLKIYGKMKIKFFTFLVTENYKGSTLQNMLQQYGPCTQRLIKKYVKTLITGLSTMHSKGHSYNILNPNNIFTDLQGNIIIDTIKARSSGRFTMEEKMNCFYYMSPELLTQGQIGFKNDTWSLGCVILAMILGTTIDQSISLHPYNQLQQLEDSFKRNNKKTQQILSKLIKFKKQYIQSKKYQNINVKSPFQKSNKIKNKSFKYSKNIVKRKPTQLEISQSLYDFVNQCLKIIGRPQIRSLLNHSFLRD